MERLPVSEQEKQKIEVMRERIKSAHALDSDAVEAFKSGRGVFDVDLGNRRLAAFFEDHPQLKRELHPDYAVGFPSMNVPGIGRVYFAYPSTR